MKFLMFAVALAVSPLNSQAAECATPNSGDRVIINDQEYVLIRAGDWDSVTQKVETCVSVWDKMHDTESGRTSLHGKRGHATITNGMIVVEYADGYTYSETAKANAIRNMKTPTATGTRTADKIEQRASQVLMSREMSRLKERRALRKSILANPVEYTVEKEAGK